ncbi:uncharacterized protein [Elaeis guineensis]|uniref:uncharacterized protein isoform X2 n=1 Tax=Elaeis guineensis var. tenera TaxID=51953 RepID=UPI003C6D5EFC
MKLGHAIEFWEAYKVAVQAVMKQSSGLNDTTLKLWGGRTCLNTFMGHTDIEVLPAFSGLSSYAILLVEIKDTASDKFSMQHLKKLIDWN